MVRNRQLKNDFVFSTINTGKHQRPLQELFCLLDLQSFKGCSGAFYVCHSGQSKTLERRQRNLTKPQRFGI